MGNGKWCLAILICVMLLQVFLFCTFVEREVAPDPILRGDPTWYTFFCYDTHDAMLRRDWHRLWVRAEHSPWGVLLFLQAGLAQMVFGANRAGVLSLNLIYYLMAQVVTFYFFRRLTRSSSAGLVAAMLFMALGSPFRGGPTLNIRDFHFDLILYFLLLVSFYVVAVSDCFRRTWPSVGLGVLCAGIVATRLVSVVLFASTFGAFLLVLLWQYFLGSKARRTAAVRRLRNFWIASGIFGLLSAVPLYVARHALYNHYMRFIFDEQFRKAREGRYVMGAESKWEEAYVVAKAVFAGDLGAYFFVGLLAVIVWAVLWRLRPARVEVSGVGDQRRWSEATWLREPADKRLFFAVLICAAVTSYVVHVGYTIKSDHMTRATAAPLFLMLLMVVIPRVSRTVFTGVRSRAAAGGAVGIAVVAGLATQFAFYTGSGRGHEHRSEIPAVTKLFDDIGDIANRLQTDSLAVSVDAVESFSLGGLMNYCSYEYERNGVLRKVHPQLGFPIEEGVDKDKALSLLGASDIVLLTRGEVPPGWPVAESLRPFRKEIHKFVSERFTHHSTHVLFGLRRDLFFRRRWQVTASASTAPEFGPEHLLSNVGRIWHAPWDGKHPQWVMFRSPEPVVLRHISITAQDGAPDRAPRAFVLQTGRDAENWTDVLDVRNAAFSREKMSLKWPVDQDEPSRLFRLWVTENCGNPTLLTIQNMELVTKAEAPN